jgi:hypothetical protein
VVTLLRLSCWTAAIPVPESAMNRAIIATASAGVGRKRRMNVMTAEPLSRRGPPERVPAIRSC